MKKFFLLFLFFSTFTTSFACMPPSPAEIIIGTYEGKEERAHPDKNFAEGRNIEFIKISDAKKPFGENYNKIGKYFFLHSDNNDVNFDLSNYKPGDQIIMLSDYNNGNFEDYFAVYKIGKLVRTTKGDLDIINTNGTSQDWGKSMWWCGNYKDKNVMTREELLQKVAYYIDVGVPVYDSNYNIFYYISGAFLIDRFIAGKGETYIGIGLLLQVLVFVFYGFILFYFAKFISKGKFNKKIVISFIIILLILLLSYLLLFNKGIF